MKRLLALILALAMVFAMATVPASAHVDEGNLTYLDAKETYIAVGYKNNDCVLTANVYMLRRAAIMLGSTTWDGITNNTLRAKACTSKNGSSLKFEYVFEKDGIKYEVVHDYLTGTKASKTKKLKKLLKDHPEGVVARGRATGGFGHGLLITSFEDGKFYAVDSTQNKGGANKGILPLSKTTVPDLATCQHIWYIKEISGDSLSAAKNCQVENLVANFTEDGMVTLTWTEHKDCVDFDGYVIYMSRDGEDFETLMSSKKETVSFLDTKNGETYYFMVRGYVKNKDYKIYSKGTTIAVTMSGEKA